MLRVQAKYEQTNPALYSVGQSVPVASIFRGGWTVSPLIAPQYIYAPFAIKIAGMPDILTTKTITPSTVYAS
jgi:hypothetical protein